MRSPLFGISTMLPGVVAQAACYIPARRATRVDPIAGPRYESGRLGFAVLEQVEEAPVDALDGAEKLLNTHGLASHFVCG